MKKIIETDLVSIAHKILQLKEKSDINTLLVETEKLYQKLILLKFYEDNKFRLEPHYDAENLIRVYDKEDIPATDENPINQQEWTEKKKGINFSSDFMTHDIIHELVEDSKNDVASNIDEWNEHPEAYVLSSNQTSKAAETLKVDQIPEPKEEKANLHSIEESHAIEEFTPSVEETSKSIDEIREEMDEILAMDPIQDSQAAIERTTLEIDPVFTVDHNQLFQDTTTVDSSIESVATVDDSKKQSWTLENQHFISNQSTPSTPFHQIPINRTINDAFNGTIVVGLNDRIAFEKHLFDGNSEDLNRVISQLNTISSYQEAVDFIEDLVKPDFNYWKDKEEYEQRFMQLVKQRFL